LIVIEASKSFALGVAAEEEIGFRTKDGDKVGFYDDRTDQSAV
jgi:hypothetical protein